MPVVDSASHPLSGTGTASRPSRMTMFAARNLAYTILLLTDAASILAGFGLAETARDERWLSPLGLPLALLAIPVYVVVAVNNGAYTVAALESATEGIRRATSSLAFSALLIVLATFFTQSGLLVSRVAFATALLASAAIIIAMRLLVARFYLRQFGGRLRDELLIVDGDGDAALMARCRKSDRVIRAADYGLSPSVSQPEKLDALARVVRQFDRVIISCPAERQSDWALVLKGTNVTGEIVLRDNNGLGVIGVGEFAGHDTVVVSRGRLSLVNRMKKRAFDLAIAVPCLILLGPLLIAVAIAIKLDSTGPVMFRQKRMGQNNSIFEILKFRSMKVENSDAAGNRSTSRDDDRITRVGRFIRSTSIDELPQLINVLQGEMSIVGPRPHALGSTAGDKLFWEIDPNYWIRHAIKPGITGLAQIRGFRGATHEQADLENRLQSDLEYLNGWRLWRDVTILFATVKVLLHPNAY